MSISYQIEHEQRKDAAVLACIELHEEIEEKKISRMTQAVQNAWHAGRKLKLGVMR